MSLLMKWLRRLPMMANESKKLIGKDELGNTYYELLRAGRTPSRVVFSPNNDETSFSDANIPVQWQAWLRSTRKLPPSDEEIAQDIRFKAILERRIKMVEAISGKIEAPPLPPAQTQQQQQQAPAAPKLDLDHASAKSFSESTSKTFVPDSWQPGKPS